MTSPTNPIVQTRTVDDHGTTYTALVFWCPGCERVDENGERHAGLHMLPVNSTTKTPQWDWDGSLEAPTLSPSILTRYKRPVPGQDGPWVEQVCHSFMRAGQMEFLGDCTHQYAGQTVPLPPLPDWAVCEVQDAAEEPG